MLDAFYRRLDAVGIRTTTARDALLGAVVAAWSIGLFVVVMRLVSSELGIAFGAGPVLAHLPVDSYAAACAVIVAQAMALTLRRRAPLVCLGLTLVGQLALTLLLPPLVSFQAPAGIIAVYSLGAYGGRRTAVWWAGGAAVVQVLLGYVVGGGDAAAELGAPAGTQLWGGLASALAVYLGAAVVGAYVAARRELLVGLRTQVAQADRERQAIAARAVLEERGRMARELHDVAAHHLSGIVVQASAAERLVDRDPHQAKESLRWIRSQGRETLDNLRLVVGILRDSVETADGGPSRPQPTLADVPELVDLARSTGVNVREITDGVPFALPPTVQLTVYRVLQEALSNARRHAPGSPVEIGTTYGADSLVLTVRNAMPGDAAGRRGRRSEDDHVATQAVPGHGLIGMRERAEFVGGTLDVGPVPGGRWRVRIAIPRPVSSAGVGASTPSQLQDVR